MSTRPDLDVLLDALEASISYVLERHTLYKDETFKLTEGTLRELNQQLELIRKIRRGL